MIKPGWEIRRIRGSILLFHSEHVSDYSVDTSMDEFKDHFPKFSRVFFTKRRWESVPIRKPIIRFLDAPTDNCWWLSRYDDYSIWLKRPVFWKKRMFMGQDDDLALVEMCGYIFEAVYPHLKMRKNTVKPINKISFIRR